MSTGVGTGGRGTLVLPSWMCEGREFRKDALRKVMQSAGCDERRPGKGGEPGVVTSQQPEYTVSQRLLPVWNCPCGAVDVKTVERSGKSAPGQPFVEQLTDIPEELSMRNGLRAVRYQTL